MPVIVYKTMSIDVRHVQVRRIACENCAARFSVVHAGNFTSQTTGVPVLSSDDGMRKQALSSALKRLQKIARKRHAGVARCPSCNEAQQWMSRNTYAGNIGCLGAILLCGGGIAGAIYALFADIRAAGPMAVGALVGFVVGSALGAFASKRSLEGPPGDPRALDDDGLRRLLRTCEEHDLDPALAWYYGELGNKAPPPKSMVVSLGISDPEGTFAIPDDMRTDTVLTNLRLAAQRRR